MLDVIVTISADTPAAWVAQCLASVQRARANASYPIRIVEQPGVPGHVGRAMVQGFARTTAPYVTWVDDDDWVLPNAFSCLTPHFGLQPAAICAREIQYASNGSVELCEQRHHLSAWRRDVVARAPLAEHRASTLPVLFEQAGDAVADEMSWVYMRRIRYSGAAKLRGTV